MRQMQGAVGRDSKNKSFSFVKSYEAPDSTMSKTHRPREWDASEEDNAVTRRSLNKTERSRSLTSLEVMDPELKDRMLRNVEWKNEVVEAKSKHHTPWFSPRSLLTKEKPVKGVLRKKTTQEEKLHFQRLTERKQARFAKMVEGSSIILIDQFLCKPHQRWFYLSEDGTELCWEKEWETKLHKKTGFKFPLKKKKKISCDGCQNYLWTFPKMDG